MFDVPESSDVVGNSHSVSRILNGNDQQNRGHCPATHPSPELSMGWSQTDSGTLDIPPTLVLSNGHVRRLPSEG